MNYALIKVINGEFYFSIEVLPNFDEEQARDAVYKVMKADFKYYTQYAWKRKRFSDVSYRGVYAVTENNNLIF